MVDCIVDQSFNLRHKTFGEWVELKVHSCREWLHIAAGHRHSPFIPDHTTQNVQSGMGAHQLMTTLPFNLAVHRGADGRRVARNGVPDMVGFLAHIDDSKPTEYADVVWLATTCGIERRAVKCNCVVTAGNNRGFKRREVRVVKIEQLGQ